MHEANTTCHSRKRKGATILCLCGLRRSFGVRRNDFASMFFQIHMFVFFCLFFVSFVSSSKDQVSPAVVIYVLFKLALQPLTWQSWRGEREVFKIKGGNT